MNLIALKQRFGCPTIGALRRAIEGLADDTPVECDFGALTIWHAARVKEVLDDEVAAQLPTDLVVAYDYGEDGDEEAAPIFVNLGIAEPEDADDDNFSF